MKIRRSIAAAGTAAVLVLGGTAALLVPAAASAADATHTPTHTHTLTVSVVLENSVTFPTTTSGTPYLEQDTVFNSAGETVGFDNEYLNFTTNTSASGNVTLAINGGILYGTLVTTDGVQTISGRVTGGTGAFAGATGRFAGKALTPTKGIVTLTYRTEGARR
jgi:hypothetical protein